MIVTHHGNTVRIVLADKAGNRAKSFLLIQLFFFSLITCGAIALVVSLIRNERLIAATALSIIAVFPAIISLRLLVRISRMEYIVLTPDALHLVSKKLGNHTSHQYIYTSISNLCYVGKSRHMRMDAMDTWAFEQRANIMVDQGDIAFYYNGEMIRFGAGAVIWDIEELNKMIEEKSAGVLSIAGLPENIATDAWQAGYSQPH